MHWNTASMYKMQWDSLTVKLNGSSCVTFQCCRNMILFHMTLGSSDLKMYAQKLPSSILRLMMIAQLNTPSSIVSTNSELTKTKLSNLPKQEKMPAMCLLQAVMTRSLTLKPSSQLTQRHPLVKKHPTAWRATW